MPENTQLQLEGISVDTIYTSLIDQGITQTDAAILASAWIFQNFGKTKRVFNYRTDFPEVNPECIAQFSRTFSHQDWIDGESVVQAEQTVGEEGFNARFHRIEADLDALGTDVGKVFACLAEMRSNLRSLLDEVRAEINRLNDDVHECCNQGNNSGGGPSSPPFSGLINNAVFQGVTNLGDNTVSLWNTGQGTLILPAVQTIGIDSVVNDRFKQVADLAEYVNDNSDVQEAFANGDFTKQDFVIRFGEERTEEGYLVKDLVDILPENTAFNSLDDMVETVSERQAAAVRTTSGASSAIALIYGTQTVSQATVDSLQTIPKNVRTALTRNGIDTVNKFSQSSVGELSDILTQEKIEFSSGELAKWTTTAKTLNRI